VLAFRRLQDNTLAISNHRKSSLWNLNQTSTVPSYQINQFHPSNFKNRTTIITINSKKKLQVSQPFEVFSSTSLMINNKWIKKNIRHVLRVEIFTNLSINNLWSNQLDKNVLRDSSLWLSKEKQNRSIHSRRIVWAWYN
jgi:hypothetical protein